MNLFQSLHFVQRQCSQYLNPGETKLLLTTLSIIEMQLNDACQENPDDFEKHLSAWIQAALVFGTVWGIGGILDSITRNKFDIFLKSVSNTLVKNLSSIL